MFAFALILERLAIALGIIILITQVLIPLAMDKPLFWLFRKKARKAFEEQQKKDFDETVEHLKEQKEKTAKAEADLNAEIAIKVEKVNELVTKPSEEKAKDPQQEEDKK